MVVLLLWPHPLPPLLDHHDQMGRGEAEGILCFFLLLLLGLFEEEGRMS